MDKPMNNLHFFLMSLGFIFRDLLFSPKSKLLELGIVKAGDYVLDYGCGTGSYSIAAARLVGNSGRVYALDIHSLSTQKIKKSVSKKKLKNVITIQSDCATGLESNMIDIVLLFDTFHNLDEPGGILKELHRVLKPRGILSFNDHHMNEEQILSEITKDHQFALSRRHKKSYLFSRV